MRYSEFKNKVLNLPVIKSKDITIFETDPQIIRNQLKRWEDKGLIIKLRRGIYILNARDRKINSSKQFIANQLYAPSYISLEYALNFYGLIPERVFAVTSITTKKTARFVNDLGEFIYQHIKPEAFRGFKAVTDECDLPFFIAEPEKAIVDFLYLNLSEFQIDDKYVFRNSYRFQNVETLSLKRIMEFAGLFNKNKLTEISGLFCGFIKKEAKR